MQSKLLNGIARETVSDGKKPNLYFVTDGGDTVTITTDKEIAYAHWRKLAFRSPCQECALEDRLFGTICSVEPREEGDKHLVVYDDYIG